jgi:UDP-glucose 4-epimerase
MIKLAGGCALLTGASGFIGTHLSAALLDVGCKVHGTTRAKAPSAGDGVTWHRVDLTDSNVVRELVQQVQPDFVFHLASHVMGSPDLGQVLPTFHANLQTTVNLLAACVSVGCQRVILTSSLVEPGDPYSERVPSSPYAAAKWASSQYGRMFHQLYGLPVSIARVFMVYGPAQFDNSKLIPHTITMLRHGRSVKVGNWRRLIDWVYVDDVVSGLVAMAEAGGIEGDSVDLGSGATISTRDLILELHSQLGSSAEIEFGAVSDRPHEPIRRADVAKSWMQIGWRARVELAEGLRRTLNWYGANDTARACRSDAGS